eukprot:scaffold59367_cov46-Phaeocystis_antarctica.AAC.1
MSAGKRVRLAGGAVRCRARLLSGAIHGPAHVVKVKEGELHPFDGDRQASDVVHKLESETESMKRAFAGVVGPIQVDLAKGGDSSSTALYLVIVIPSDARIVLTKEAGKQVSARVPSAAFEREGGDTRGPREAGGGNIRWASWRWRELGRPYARELQCSARVTAAITVAHRVGVARGVLDN